mmetsp:Transcript_18630/g.21386  ORF Transcript_18630/g.21386 Transcript_18630/m.21386 type:complete len:83 (+) Transcript_18630:193-441(+)
MTASNNNNPTTTMNNNHKNSISREAQMGIMIFLLGTSAGLTLYMTKSDALLKKVSNIRKYQRFPTKFGPVTKQEWEKLKPRW